MRKGQLATPRIMCRAAERMRKESDNKLACVMQLRTRGYVHSFALAELERFVIRLVFCYCWKTCEEIFGCCSKNQ